MALRLAYLVGGDDGDSGVDAGQFARLSTRSHRKPVT